MDNKALVAENKLLLKLVERLSVQMPFVKFASIFCKGYSIVEKDKCLSDFMRITKMAEVHAKTFIENARPEWLSSS